MRNLMDKQSILFPSMEGLGVGFSTNRIAQNIMLILITVFLTSCNVWDDWTLPDSNIVMSITIQKNSATTITLQSLFGLENPVENMRVDALPDTSIVSFEQGNADTLTLSGKEIGSSEILLSFHSGLDYQAILNVQVTDGFPLHLNMGECRLLSISELASLTPTEYDSISLSSHDDIAFLSVLNHDTIQVKGVWPGEIQGQVELFHNQVSVEIILLSIDVKNSRRALVELFTNSGCINCPVANEFLSEELESYEDNITVVRYHASFPFRGDIMYQYNTSVNNTMLQYYLVSATPYLIVNGSVIGDWNESGWEQALQESREETSDIYLNLTSETVGDSLIAHLELTEIHDISEALTLTFILVEDSVEHTGPNGETIHQQVMRQKTDMAFQDIVDGEYRTSFYLDDVLTQEHLSVLAYLQADDKRVIQTAFIK